VASLTSALQTRSRPVALFSLAKAAQETRAESFRIMKMKQDGRCMFRAIAYGLNKNQGQVITDQEIEKEADELRLACRDALCRSKDRRKQFSDAVYALETEDTLPKYCQRMSKTDFWGGNVELLVLSKMLKVPLVVYLEDATGGHGYRPIAKFGEDFKTRRPVRLLYINGNHYDLLL